jgi:predicted kinase
VAPDPLCRARIAARRASGGDASDATIAVFDALRDRRRPWPEADVIDTTRPVAESVAAAVMAFDR